MQRSTVPPLFKEAVKKSKSLLRKSVFSFFLFSTLPLAMTSAGYASHPLQSQCFDENKSLDSWIETIDTIIAGTAIEVQANGPGRTHNEGNCWARFLVDEWLKGQGPKEIWITSLFSVNATSEELDGLKYCEFKKGHSYLVYGAHHRNTYNPVPSEWIGTSSTYNNPPPIYLHCPPNTELDRQSRKMLLPEVRQIIKSKRTEGMQ